MSDDIIHALEHHNQHAHRVDSIFHTIPIMSTEMSVAVWKDKFKQPNETTFEDMCNRVVQGVYKKDNNTEEAQRAYDFMRLGLWIPAGRILAGAGTHKTVTLMNCYATGTIDDDLRSIAREHDNFMFTMQQGGGDGAEFSTLRPEGAILYRTGTTASGPLPFMDMWNSMCYTIKSAGDRRGAMMATFSDTHPDLPKFIVAKQTPGRLTNFNVSVLISSAFMEAVEEDEQWYLHFSIPPKDRNPDLVQYDFIDDNGIMQYVYSVWRARELWTMIKKNTYEYSEPGIIFIDRVNEFNNLWYCENIRTSNPCGEQPLPPHGACDLGHINIARMIKNPFKENAYIDWDLLQDTVRMGVRFLDNVIDVTGFPLEEQRIEAFNKRRIGLGFTGLASAFAMLGVRYGGMRSINIASSIARTIALTTYDASIDLAVERGPFPMFDSKKYLSGESFVTTQMPDSIKNKIALFNGIRNGVLNTVAPTGTVSIVYGNLDGGLECAFAHRINRKILQADNSYKHFTELSFAAALYYKINGYDPDDTTVVLPSYMVTMADLTVEDHIYIQAAVQQWIDASVSKTVNVPKDITFEAFEKVYDLAYISGCKGCTTYRPSDVRGSILTDANAVTKTAESSTAPVEQKIADRPQVLEGRTYKIKWPNRDSAFYLTINSDEYNRPFEIFITSKDGTNAEWTTALSLMLTGIFRSGGDISYISRELKQIQSLRDGAWINGRYVGSLPAYIGEIIEQHLKSIEVITEDKTTRATATVTKTTETTETTKLISATSVIVEPVSNQFVCPKCGFPTMIRVESCMKCVNCGHSECS